MKPKKTIEHYFQIYKHLKMNKGKYPPEAFDRFMDFIDEIKNADKDKAIIVKNEDAK